MVSFRKLRSTLLVFFPVGNLRRKVSLQRMSKLTTKSSFFFVKSTCQLPVITSIRHP